MRTTTLAFALILTSCALALSCANHEEQRRVAEDRAVTAVADALIAGDYPKALVRAEAELKRRPGDPWLLYDKGAALAGLGRTDDALEVLRKAEAAFPPEDLHGRGVAIYRRALALEVIGRCNEASTEYSRWASLVRPSHAEVVEDVANHVQYCVGPSIEQLSRELETQELMALRDDPVRREADQASTASVHAMVRSDYETALAVAEEGLKVSPDDAWLLYNKGTALAALGRVPEGLQVLKEAEAHFDEGETHGRQVVTYDRALILESIGRCEEAANEFRRYDVAVGRTEPLAEAHTRAHLRFCHLVNATGGTL